MRSIIANLMPASGHQDHTPSPSACRCVRRLAQQAAIASRYPTFVTIAKRPHGGAGRSESLKLLLPTGEAKYFFPKGWTGGITLIGLDELPGRRRRSRPYGTRLFKQLLPQNTPKHVSVAIGVGTIMALAARLDWASHAGIAQREYDSSIPTSLHRGYQTAAQLSHRLWLLSPNPQAW